jgi:UrcA family protein
MNITKFQKSGYTFEAILGATLMLGLTATASATDLVGPDIAVQYESVIIESERGAAQLLKRIEAAAGRVCARLDHGSLTSRKNVQACSHKLTADAVRKVNHPMLLAVYTSGGGVSPPVASVAK